MKNVTIGHIKSPNFVLEVTQKDRISMIKLPRTDKATHVVFIHVPCIKATSGVANQGVIGE